jgi:arylsulfatase A-like enzyme
MALHRLFQSLAAFALLTGHEVSTLAGPAGQGETRPNILFCIADDWSWPHAGVYGDSVVKTPTFDRVAAEGALFTHSFCASPSCSPSRAGILTGQAIHRLEEGGNLWGTLPVRYPVYSTILEKAGYHVGSQGKGWGPGNIQVGGHTRNPAGKVFRSFKQFLQEKPKDAPFCFWYGSTDPHRPYDLGSGARSGMKAADVRVPPFLADTPEVRSDILDYYFEVERFDRTVSELLKELADAGLVENTLVVITSDNGMPFPRAKTNLHDSGSRMPLAIRWPAKIKPGQKHAALVSHTDFAPTFLEAAGLPALPEMTGKSLLPLLLGKSSEPRDTVFIGRERHANVRKGDLSYPARAVRTREFLYIRNFRPERWPAGDPELWKAVGPFGDIDGSPSKDLILNKRDDPAIAPFFNLACAKRPAEELYDLAKDPWQVKNVAGQPEYAEAQRKLRAALDKWLQETGDPRLGMDDDRWDKFPYYGGPAR